VKRIAVEEHFSTKEHLDYMQAVLDKKYPVPGIIEEEKYLSIEVGWYVRSFSAAENVGNLIREFLDVGSERLKGMDEAGIDTHVLSLVSPGVNFLDAAAATDLAGKTNDTIAPVLEKYPERFVGLATIAPQNPEEAAEELKRAVLKLGFRGAVINSHIKGEHLDNEKFWPLFAAAEELEVPIYIHPRLPRPDMLTPYLDYPGLSLSMLGFSHEVSLHVLRMILNGVFDEFPGLNIIIGHMGEALPYWLGRIDQRWQPYKAIKKQLKKEPSEYFRENFFISTSGMFWNPPLQCALATVGADRILFAVDYPMESSKQAVSFIDSAQLSDGDREKICHLNAEKLFKL